MDYKAKAQAYYTAVSEYDEATVQKMLREDYIQHNPKVPTGRAAFVGFLPKLREHRTKIVNIRLINDGAHVIMHHVWNNAAPFGAEDAAAFHIIRFDESGLIAEHWNVMMNLTPTNPSGRTLVDGETGVRDLDKTDVNKHKVNLLMEKLISGSFVDLAKQMRSFFLPSFHQHHPAIADGIAGFEAALNSKILEISIKKLHRVFAEGHFVLSITEGTLCGSSTAFYDLFRFENAMIAEHWSIYQEIPAEGLANDNTMFNFTS